MLTYYNKSDQAIPESQKNQHYNYSTRPDSSRVHAWKREMHHYDALIFNRHSDGMFEESCTEPNDSVGNNIPKNNGTI